MIGRNIDPSNYIPGCESYTKASEISSLQKYLKKGIEKRDSELKAVNERLAAPGSLDPRLPGIPGLSDKVIGLNATDTVRLEERLELLTDHRVTELSVDRDDLVVTDTEHLEDRRENLVDTRTDALVDRAELLTGTSEDIDPRKFEYVENLRNHGGYLKDADKLVTEAVGLNNEKNTDSLSEHKETIQGNNVKELSRTVEQINPGSGLDKLSEDSIKLNGKKDIEDLESIVIEGGYVRNIELSGEKEVLAGSKDPILNNTVVDLKIEKKTNNNKMELPVFTEKLGTDETKETKTLPEEKESLSVVGSEPKLEKHVEGLEDSTKKLTELPKESVELGDDRVDPKLEKTKVNIETPKKTQELEGTIINLDGANKEVELNKTLVQVEQTKQIEELPREYQKIEDTREEVLDKTRVDLEGRKDTELETILISLEKSEEDLQKLPEPIVNLEGNRENLDLDKTQVGLENNHEVKSLDPHTIILEKPKSQEDISLENHVDTLDWNDAIDLITSKDTLTEGRFKKIDELPGSSSRETIDIPKGSVNLGDHKEIIETEDLINSQLPGKTVTLEKPDSQIILPTGDKEKLEPVKVTELSSVMVGLDSTERSVALPTEVSETLQGKNEVTELSGHKEELHGPGEIDQLPGKTYNLSPQKTTELPAVRETIENNSLITELDGTVTSLYMGDDTSKRLIVPDPVNGVDALEDEVVGLTDTRTTELQGTVIGAPSSITEEPSGLDDTKIGLEGDIPAVELETERLGVDGEHKPTESLENHVEELNGKSELPLEDTVIIAPGDTSDENPLENHVEGLSVDINNFLEDEVIMRPDDSGGRSFIDSDVEHVGSWDGGSSLQGYGQETSEPLKTHHIDPKAPERADWIHRTIENTGDLTEYQGDLSRSTTLESQVSENSSDQHYVDSDVNRENWDGGESLAWYASKVSEPIKADQSQATLNLENIIPLEYIDSDIDHSGSSWDGGAGLGDYGEKTSKPIQAVASQETKNVDNTIKQGYVDSDIEHSGDSWDSGSSLKGYGQETATPMAPENPDAHPGITLDASWTHKVDEITDEGSGESYRVDNYLSKAIPNVNEGYVDSDVEHSGDSWDGGASLGKYGKGTSKPLVPLKDAHPKKTDDAGWAHKIDKITDEASGTAYREDDYLSKAAPNDQTHTGFIDSDTNREGFEGGSKLKEYGGKTESDTKNRDTSVSRAVGLPAYQGTGNLDNTVKQDFVDSDINRPGWDTEEKKLAAGRDSDPIKMDKSQVTKGVVDPGREQGYLNTDTSPTNSGITGIVNEYEGAVKDNKDLKRPGPSGKYADKFLDVDTREDHDSESIVDGYNTGVTAKLRDQESGLMVPVTNNNTYLDTDTNREGFKGTDLKGKDGKASPMVPRVTSKSGDQGLWKAQTDLGAAMSWSEDHMTGGWSKGFTAIPAYKFGGGFTSYLNPSKYIRWMVENTVGAIPLKGTLKTFLLNETLVGLITARDYLEKTAGIQLYRIPGSNEHLIQKLRWVMSGIETGDLLSMGMNIASNLLNRASVVIKQPINRPGKDIDSDMKKMEIFETKDGHNSADFIQRKQRETKGGVLKAALKAVDRALGGNRGLKDYDPTYSYMFDLLGEDKFNSSDAYLGLYGTLFHIGEKGACFSNFGELKQQLELSPYYTSSIRTVGVRAGDVHRHESVMTLDSNHVWEIILEPYLGVNNGNRSYLPSIQQINYENDLNFGLSTNWNTWIPFTSFELNTKKMMQKNINLYAGELSIPQNLEFTNELRLVICDDQYKSWKRYFEYVMYASIYYSEAKDPSYYEIKYLKGINLNNQEFTSNDIIHFDKGIIRPAPYKNLTFRCKILSMNTMLQTINVSDLLVVLKEFQEEWQGEVDASPTELSLMFSVVGENPRPTGSPSDDDVSNSYKEEVVKDYMNDYGIVINE